MTVKTRVVKVGDELPCHQSNVLHTTDVTDNYDEAYQDKAVLRVWYVEQGDSDV